MKQKKITSFWLDTDFLRMFIVTLLIFISMSLLSPKFTRSSVILSMGYQIPELGFYSLAMMMVMVTGGRDLSVVGIGNLAGIFGAMIMHLGYERCPAGSPAVGYVLLGVAAALATGLVCGIINGLFVSRFNIPAMLLTMATNYIFTGLSSALTDAQAVTKIPDSFAYLGNNVFLGIPIPLWMLLLALAFSACLLNRTRYGFEVRMLGSNPKASHYSGMNNRRILMKTYIYSGIMSAMAGLIILARTSTAKADYASTYTFQAILCAVLGATAPNGGFAKISCMVLSLASLQFLSSGFSLLRLGGYFKQFAWGALLVMVLSLNYFINLYRQRRSVRAIRKKALRDAETSAKKEV